MFGVGFSDWGACESPQAVELCTGCVRLLGGRPGDVPPPLRTRTVAVCEGVFQMPTMDQVWGMLLGESDDAPSILSWAISGQRHHILYAEPCTRASLRIGSDLGTIVLYPERDRALALAVATLRVADAKGHGWCMRDEILSGQYRPSAIARSASAWSQAESLVAPRRGDAILSLLVAHCPTTGAFPVGTQSPSLEAPDMIDPLDHIAATLLESLARDSSYRITHGKEFWGGVFARRLQRYSGRPLGECISRLLSELDVPPVSAGASATLELLASYDAQAMGAVSTRLRDRPALLIALAFDLQSKRKVAASPPRTPRAAPSPTSPTNS